MAVMRGLMLLFLVFSLENAAAQGPASRSILWQCLTPLPHTPKTQAPSTPLPQRTTGPQRNLTPLTTPPQSPSTIRTTTPPAKTTEAPRACPLGWTPYGVKCYKFFNQAVNWATAERLCQTNGANLASVHSQVQNNFLLSLVPGKTRAWIGGHDCELDGVWLWSDGSPYDYANWCSGEPNNLWGQSPESCLEINRDDRFTGRRCWNDETCTNTMAYICARKL